MPFTRPSLPTLITRIKNDIKGQLSIVTILRRSFLDVVARALAAASHTLHGFLQFVAVQVFPDTAEVEFLERWGAIFDVTRIAAIKAELNILFTGTAGEVISAGAEFQRPDGFQYTLQSDATIQTATAEVSDVQCRADVGGDLGGTYFEFETPLVQYAPWFNTGGDANPAIPGRTMLEVAINDNDSANDIAIALQAVVDAVGDVSASVLGAIVTITNDDAGSVDDIEDGSLAPTSFVFTVITQGLTDGEVEGNVLADLADTDDLSGNLEDGETVSFITPQVNVDSTADVTETVTEGEVQESDDNYRARVLDRIRQPPSGGNANDYIAAIKNNVAGATRVFVFPANRGLGTVDVSFVLDDESNIVPSAAKIAEGQAAVDDFRPVTTDSIVFTQVTAPLALNIKLKPNNAAVRTQVINELQDLFFRDARARGAFSGPNTTFDGKILLSRIGEAISLAVDEQDHELESPVVNFQPGINELAILGAITWQTLV